MNTKPERLDKDGFPIPAGFDSNDPAGAPRTPRGPGALRLMRWVVLAGLLAAVWVHFDVGNWARNRIGDYLCQEAIRQYQQNNLPGALASLDRAVGWAPKHGRAVTVRMMVHLELKNWEPALDDSRRAAELEPDDDDWVGGRLKALHGLKRHRETAAFCGERLASHGEARTMLLNTRAYARALGEFELNEGLADIDEALKGDEQNAAYIDTRGYVLLKLGRTKEALEEFEKAVALTDAELEAWNDRIIELRMRQTRRQQIERLSKNLDEHRAVILHHRGEAQQKLGNKAQAEADFSEARRLGFDESQGTY